MLKACCLWFVILKRYVELTRPKIESRDPIFFTGTRARSRVPGNDRLFPRGSEFGPNPKIPACPVIQLRPRPVNWIVSYSQNDHFVIYDIEYQFLGMDAENYKFSLFFQQCKEQWVVVNRESDASGQWCWQVQLCLFESWDPLLIHF